MTEAAQAVFLTTVAEVLNVSLTQISLADIGSAFEGIQISYLVSYFVMAAPTSSDIMGSLDSNFTAKLIANAESSGSATASSFANVTPFPSTVSVVSGQGKMYMWISNHSECATLIIL
jgi:hypothetical protein